MRPARLSPPHPRFAIPMSCLPFRGLTFTPPRELDRPAQPLQTTERGCPVRPPQFTNSSRPRSQPSRSSAFAHKSPPPRGPSASPRCPAIRRHQNPSPTENPSPPEPVATQDSSRPGPVAAEGSSPPGSVAAGTFSLSGRPGVPSAKSLRTLTLSLLARSAALPEIHRRPPRSAVPRQWSDPCPTPQPPSRPRLLSARPRRQAPPWRPKARSGVRHSQLRSACRTRVDLHHVASRPTVDPNI
jgi:hypothetical protein